MDGSSTNQQRRWHIYHDGRDLGRHAARAVLGAAAEAIERHGRFDLAVSGGKALTALYHHFRDRGAGDDRWHIWFADESCLPDGHPGRNDTQVQSAWLAASAIPERNIHRVAGEGSPEDAAGLYADTIAEVGAFDLVLLGMDSDGHTAGLYPGYGIAEFSRAPDVLAVHAPRPPHGRVTLSAQRLSHARQVVLLVTGEERREAVSRWRAGADLPVSHLLPESGLDVFAEETAVPGF